MWGVNKKNQQQEFGLPRFLLIAFQRRLPVASVKRSWSLLWGNDGYSG